MVDLCAYIGCGKPTGDCSVTANGAKVICEKVKALVGKEVVITFDKDGVEQGKLLGVKIDVWLELDDGIAINAANVKKVLEVATEDYEEWTRKAIEQHG